MRIGISGANGFIGRNVVKEIAQIEDVEITVFGRNEKINDSQLFSNRVAWNIFDQNFDYDSVPKIDKFIHLAWSGIPHYDQLEHLTQISNHAKLLKEIMAKGCETVLATGTCFEYDNPSGRVSETAPVAGDSSYAEAKIELSSIVQSIADEFKCQNIWARLFYVYGPGQPSNTLFGSFQKALHADQREFQLVNGSTELDYLEVEALSEILVKLLFADSASGTFNVGSGSPVSVGKLVNSWKCTSNSDISILDLAKQPTKNFWADTSKLRSVIR